MLFQLCPAVRGAGTSPSSGQQEVLKLLLPTGMSTRCWPTRATASSLRENVCVWWERDIKAEEERSSNKRKRERSQKENYVQDQLQKPTEPFPAALHPTVVITHREQYSVVFLISCGGFKMCLWNTRRHLEKMTSSPPKGPTGWTNTTWVGCPNLPCHCSSGWASVKQLA